MLLARQPPPPPTHTYKIRDALVAAQTGSLPRTARGRARSLCAGPSSCRSRAHRHRRRAQAGPVGAARHQQSQVGLRAPIVRPRAEASKRLTQDLAQCALLAATVYLSSMKGNNQVHGHSLQIGQLEQAALLVSGSAQRLIH